MKTVIGKIDTVELRESKFPGKNGQLQHYVNLTFKDTATGDKFFLAVSSLMPPPGKEARALYKRDGGESALGKVLRSTNKVAEVATRFRGYAIRSNQDLVDFKNLIDVPIMIEVDPTTGKLSNLHAIAGSTTVSGNIPITQPTNLAPYSSGNGAYIQVQPSVQQPVFTTQPAPTQKEFPRGLV